MKIAGSVSVFFFLVAACGEIGGSGQCGGAEQTGSCLRIEKIIPSDSGGKDSPNVDAVRDICNLFEISTSATTTKPVLEKFTDHHAKLTVSNHPLQDLTANDISDITLLNFSIEYSVNQCPGGTCPAIPPQIVAPGETILIPKDGSRDFTLPFVPLAAKKAYLDAGGTSIAYPSYTATYVLTGTDSYNNKVSVKGSSEFTIGNYDLCTG